MLTSDMRQSDVPTLGINVKVEGCGSYMTRQAVIKNTKGEDPVSFPVIVGPALMLECSLCAQIIAGWGVVPALSDGGGLIKTIGSFSLGCNPFHLMKYQHDWSCTDHHKTFYNFIDSAIRIAVSKYRFEIAS